MAVHKVPQDVEAEDHFLGPFTFKQFLFAGGAAICMYLTFLMISRGVWPVAIIFFVPGFAFGVLAFPWSKDQPTDIWLTARIRYYLIPRKRIWNQDGTKNLVSVTAPLRHKAVYSDGLSQTEVRSRFGALASMVDSRGWAVKGGSIASSFAGATTIDESDRLAAGTVAAPTVKIADSDDPLDEQSSPIARQFDSMIQQSAQEHRSAAIDLVAQARAPAAPQPQQHQSPTLPEPKNQKGEDFWFLNQQQQPVDPSFARFNQQASVAPGASTPLVATAADDHDVSSTQLLERVHKQQQRETAQGHVKHERVINPAGTQIPGQGSAGRDLNTQQINTAKDNVQKPAPTPTDPAILGLARNNDLNIATLQRQGNKPLDTDGEVVIDLH